MKTRIALLLILLTSGSVRSAGEDLSITLDFAFGTKYVFRGIQLADNAFHPAIEFAQGDAYSGLWVSQPLENRGWPQEWEDEVDFYAGYGWALDEKTALDVGATFYYYPNSDNTFEPYIGVTREFKGVAASLYLYRDFDLDTTTAEGSAGYSFPLSGNSYLDLEVHYGVVDADDIGGYNYFGADAVVPFELSDKAVFSVGVHYSDNNIGFGVPDGHFFGSTSLSIGF